LELFCSTCKHCICFSFSLEEARRKPNSEEESTHHYLHIGWLRYYHTSKTLVSYRRFEESTLQWRKIAISRPVAGKYKYGNDFKKMMDGVTRKQIL